jgi:hypothetical protein
MNEKRDCAHLRNSWEILIANEVEKFHSYGKVFFVFYNHNWTLFADDMVP